MEQVGITLHGVKCQLRVRVRAFPNSNVAVIKDYYLIAMMDISCFLARANWLNNQL